MLNCGYTQEELERCFQPSIDDFARERHCSDAEMLTILADHYNGYRFSEHAVSVYNPFSILKAMGELQVKSYWFETGTPAFLIHVLKQQQYHIPDVEQFQVSHSVFTTFEIERLNAEALLFQTGYVTIKDVQQQIYTLDYPNQEVKTALSESLLFALTENALRGMSSQVLQLSRHLRDQNLEAFFTTITAVFASIPYDINAKRDEAYFHTLFYLMGPASGVDARSSVLTSRGRIDLTVVFPDIVYIIEFKCNQTAEKALQQIRKQGYAEKYQYGGRKPLLLGINFSPETRNIKEWKVSTQRPVSLNFLPIRMFSPLKLSSHVSSRTILVAVTNAEENLSNANVRVGVIFEIRNDFPRPKSSLVPNLLKCVNVLNVKYFPL
ncbi:MAG: AAA family ATPase [bacterium]|nr:AAA family ATPase [bacterium]